MKPGLIASGIVSAWTWAATLLQSSTVAYEYGVAGPFWVPADPVNLLKRGSFVLVCGRCDCTDPHVLDIGLQSQAERSEMPYILGNYLYTLRRPDALGLHLLRALNKRSGQQSASLRRKCRCHVFDRYERLCCHLSYTVSYTFGDFCSVRIAFWVARHSCESNPLLRLVARLNLNPKEDMLTRNSLRLGVCVYVVLGGLRATFLCKASRERPNVLILTCSLR